MQYGYFDDEKREYVITRPDTPAPWAIILVPGIWCDHFQTTQADTALQNQVQTEEFFVTFLTILISREDTFTSEMRMKMISGLHPLAAGRKRFKNL